MATNNVNKKINLDVNISGLKEVKNLQKTLEQLYNTTNRKKKKDPEDQAFVRDLKEEIDLTKNLASAIRDLNRARDATKKPAKSSFDKYGSFAGAFERFKNPFAGVQDQLNKSIESRKQFDSAANKLKEQIAGYNVAIEESEARLSTYKRPTRTKEYQRWLALQSGRALAGAKLEEAEGLESAAGTKALQMSALIGVGKFTVGAIKTAAKYATKIAHEFGSSFKSVTGISLSIKDNFTDILNRLHEMTAATTGLASFATETSLFTNATARETRLRYGLGAGQAYAFSKTMSTLGMKSEEDLFYMNASQRAVFVQMMERQNAWYDKLQSSGALESIQQMQLDFEMFKQEMAVDFLQWIADNKDLLLAVGKGILTVLKGLIQILGKLFTFFGIGNQDYGAFSTKVSDAAAVNSSAIYRNNNINMTMTNNANGVYSSADSMFEAMGQYMEAAVQKAVVEID